MKFSTRISLTFQVATAIWIATYPVRIVGLPDPAPQPSPDAGDHLSNADLHHLLSLLDGSVPTNGDPSLSHTVVDDLNVDASELLAVNVKPPESTTILVPTSTNRVFTRKLVRRPKTTTTTTAATTTSTTTTEGTTTTTTSTPSPTQSTTSTTQQPVLYSNQNVEASRRQDNQIENLRALVPPSQQELVQQLSMLNSLLTSLGDNTTTTIPSITPSTVPPAIAIEKKPMGNPNAFIEEMLAKIGNTSSSSSGPQAPNANDPTATLQSLALLNSLFGGSGGPVSNSNPNAAAAALLGVATPGQSSVATRQTSGNQQGLGYSDAEAAAALSELLRQTAVLGGQDLGTNPNGNGQNFQNFQNTNGNLDPAASNQISGLLSLLGTLGSINQPQQQGNSLFNLAQNNPVQQQQTNFLTSLLGQQQQPQNQANALSSLFGAASQPQNQAFNIGNLFAAQNSAPSIPGLGLLSTVGSLGSSIISTMSNILGGSGSGGKPRVRGKGVDTRLGLGYRFGDAADAQIVWDVGPQLYTDSIRNENRPSMIKSKSQQVDHGHQLLNTNARVEKEQQQIAAAKRLLQLQMQQHDMQTNHFLNRRLALNNLPRTTKKPLSLLDMWNLGKSKGSVIPISHNQANFHQQQQSMMPHVNINQNDAWQMLRHKNFMKRSSSSPDRKPYYAKPEEDPLEGHSTLTTYEQMLLTHGKDFGMVGKENKQSFKPKNNNRPYKHPTPSEHESKTINRPYNHPTDEEDFYESHHNRNNPRNRPRPSNSIRPFFQKQNNNFNSKQPPRPQQRPRPQHNKENYGDSQQGSKPWNEFTSSHTSPPQERPGLKRPPLRQKPKDVRRRNPGFSFSNFFSKMRGKPSARRRPPPTTSRPAERRYDDHSQFQDFTDTSNHMMMADSNDHFYARNRNNPLFVEEKPYISSARLGNKKSNLPRIPMSTLSHKSGQGLSKVTAELNPEAEDSFNRRNAVVINPKLKEAEKQKMFRNHPTLPSKVLAKNIINNKYNTQHNTKRKDLDNQDEPHSKQDPKQSVMNLFKNFLSSKIKARNSNATSSISSLKSILSDPSSLNPMKILPIRKKNRPESPNIKTKLTIVDGEPKIVEVTELAEKEEAKPIVHVGEDMSFEDLTKLFGSAKNSTKGKRRKLKKSKSKVSTKERKSNPRVDEDEEVEFEDRADKIDIKKAKDDKEEEDEYDDDDGLKGIFIDIDSGEVNVMKPVASLTSFEPKKESSEEEVDDYEDGDGDGIADADMKRKQEIFDEIQDELKRNYKKLQKAHERAEAKKKRKEELAAKGMDESMDVVSKYFDMIDDTSNDEKKETKKTLKIKF